MANGAAWPLDACTTEQIAAFIAAATYLELDEVANLIGRLEPDDALSHEYWHLGSSFGEDASLIRDAVRCELVEAPSDWVLAPLSQPRRPSAMARRHHRHQHLPGR